MTALHAGRWRDVQVRAIRLETPTVRSFELVPADGMPLPHWTAGAHIDIALPDGGVRQYSLCGDPSMRQCPDTLPRLP